MIFILDLEIKVRQKLKKRGAEQWEKLQVDLPRLPNSSLEESILRGLQSFTPGATQSHNNSFMESMKRISEYAKKTREFRAVAVGKEVSATGPLFVF